MHPELPRPPRSAPGEHVLHAFRAPVRPVPSRRGGGALLLLAAGIVLLPGPAPAQEAPAGPGAATYALVNARVVVSPGTVHERATVVLAEGWIQAVGPDAAIPEGARVVDLEGLTLYPGLVDAAASAPLAGAQPPPEGAPALDPARRAWEVAELDGEARAAWRAVGVTALGLAYHGGTDGRPEPGPQFSVIQREQPLLPGRTSAVSLGDGGLDALLLPAAPAVQVGFGTRRIHAYPVTLMGSIAFLHQAFLDAGHQRMLREAHARDPGAVLRPDFRPEVEALEAAAAGEERTWITVTQENNLIRAVELADELGLDYGLLGGQEGYRIAARLAGAGAPLLLSLEYPPVERVTGRSWELHLSPASGPDAALARADSAAARELRGNAAALVSAGVPVALTSWGLEDPGIFRERVLGAVEAGLSAEEALRALTTTPASLLGLEAELGTLERGKRANVVVVEGDLFEPTGRIRHVFVEGVPFDVDGSPLAAGTPVGPGGMDGGER